MSQAKVATYKDSVQAADRLSQAAGPSWDRIDAEAVARMRTQNRFQTGLDIARYTATIMRRDMAAYVGS